MLAFGTYYLWVIFIQSILVDLEILDFNYILHLQYDYSISNQDGSQSIKETITGKKYFLYFTQSLRLTHNTNTRHRS